VEVHLSGALTELLPLAMDITENSKKMPYVFTEISSYPTDKAQVIAFSPEDLSSDLTVQNYHAMLKYLEKDFKRGPQDFKAQQSQGFRLMIDFDILNVSGKSFK